MDELEKLLNKCQKSFAGYSVANAVWDGLDAELRYARAHGLVRQSGYGYTLTILGREQLAALQRAPLAAAAPVRRNVGL